MAVAEYVLDDPNFVADYVHDTAARHTVLRRLREKGFGELTGTGRQICELALALTGPALFQTAVDASIAESSEAA